MQKLSSMLSRCVSNLLPAAVTIIVLSRCALPAMAQGFRYGDFSDTSKLALNGTLSGTSTANFPVKVGTALRLTPASQDEAASAWYKTKQPVTGGFTTIFQFQMSSGSAPPADGIAFVIQNAAAGTAALGTDGGAIGYGGNVTCTGEGGSAPCVDDTAGIPASIAIEFDTFVNPPWDPDANHVAVQSCGPNANTSDHTNCSIAAPISVSPSITLSDGNIHTAFIQYVPSTCSGAIPAPNLTLSVDNIDNVVLTKCVNLSTLGVADSTGSAYVGFTAATGGSFENQDLLNWEFVTPVTVPLNGNATTNAFNFPFAQYNVIYPSDVKITNTTMTVSPAVYSFATCNSMIQSATNTSRNFTGDEPTCTTFSNLYNLSSIFDLTCSANGALPSTSPQCPKTTGFNPFTGGMHNGEDIINYLVYSTNDPAPIAPQMLTAPEGTNNWIPFGLGFQTDCCTRGSGTSSYNSLVVSADFPAPNPAFTIPPYKFVGFVFPVLNSSTGKVNIAEAGDTIPFGWRLLYPTAPSLGFNGGPVTNLTFLPAGTLAITSTKLPLSAMNPPVLINTQSGFGLVNLGAGFYLFPWKTQKTFAGSSYRVTLTTGDNVNHSADFKFIKDF
jgi:Bacterial lectin